MTAFQITTEQCFSIFCDCRWQARLQTARIQARLGNYVAAESSLKTYLSRNKSDAIALELQKQIAKADISSKKAERAKNKKNWEQCVEAATEAIAISNANLKLLALRANCNAKLDRVEEAVGDLRCVSSFSFHSRSSQLDLADMCIRNSPAERYQYHPILHTYSPNYLSFKHST